MERMLLFMLLFSRSIIRLTPALYRGFVCEEPVPSYGQRFLSFLTYSEIPRMCPTTEELLVGTAIEMILFLGAMTGGLVALKITPNALAYLEQMVLMIKHWFLEWKSRPVRCRLCKCTPCQTLRHCLWMPSVPLPKHESNYVLRSRAMFLFDRGLEISATLDKQIEMDELYWERCFAQSYGEEQLALFPKCIRVVIDRWYPVPTAP